MDWYLQTLYVLSCHSDNLEKKVLLWNCVISVKKHLGVSSWSICHTIMFVDGSIVTAHFVRWKDIQEPRKILPTTGIVLLLL